MSEHPLISLATEVANGRPRAITSVCSAHPLVIEATLLSGLTTDGPVLIEATCNQVNQDGGYTGMTPAVFREFVETIAKKISFPIDRLMLGGDHLGPNPWRSLPTEVAMAKADAMIESYARAGFSKLHLDTSMAVGDDASPTPQEDVVAARAARLASIAETATREVGLPRPVYIIGTEVPVPGGALETLGAIEVTRPEDAIRTVELHNHAFQAAGIADAFMRCVGLVVQPGVEFDSDDVAIYQPDKAAGLAEALHQIPGFVFEAHSTDYQPQEALTALVRDGFGILKVGPGLTFALRETLYGLDSIAVELGLLEPAERVSVVMERLMLHRPADWTAHYHGTPSRQQIQRHFSYSDRIRYYWHYPLAQTAVQRLVEALERHTIPKPLISQYLGAIYPKVISGRAKSTARSLLISGVQHALEGYDSASHWQSSAL